MPSEIVKILLTAAVPSGQFDADKTLINLASIINEFVLHTPLINSDIKKLKSLVKFL
jgi:hypothetical protein